MDVSWPSALRTVGAYCLGSLFAGKRSQDKSTDTDNLVVPRENAWRKVARCARPLVLTIAAVLSLYLQREGAALDDLTVISAQNKVLWTSSPKTDMVSADDNGVKHALHQDAPSLSDKHGLTVITPIHDDQLHVALQLAVQHAASQKGHSLVTRYSSAPVRAAVRIVDLEEQLRTTVA